MDTTVISLIIFTISTILITQGLFNSYLMLYAWAKVQENVRFRSPRIYAKPQHTFTAIIPARHEEDVIGHTIRSVARISYPLDMTEIIVVLRQDDHDTIAKAQEALATIGQKNIRILTFDGYPINKPHGLNHALRIAQGEVIVIFDAEDEPHPKI